MGQQLVTEAEGEHASAEDWLGPHAPDAGIAGVHLFRSMIQPAYDDREDHLSWSMVGRVNVADEWTLLWGDLFVAQDDWELGVTVSAMIQYRGGALPFDADDEDAMDAHIRALAPWASHAMYDVAAQWARQLEAATYPAPDFDIPVRTPALDDVTVHLPSDVEPETGASTAMDGDPA